MTNAEKRKYFEMGGRIRAIRHLRGLTIEQLAKKVDLGRASMNNIEVGKQGAVRVHMIARIAKALGVSMYLILDKPYPIH